MKRLLQTATVLLGAAALAASAYASSAHAASVVLRAAPVDADGRITLGELFEGAGSAAHVVVGQRAGSSAVLDAGQVQVIARRAGLEWNNPTGLRRIVVREGTTAASTANTQSAAARPGAMVEALTFTRSLAANEPVQPEDVAWTQVQAHLAPANGPQDAADVIGLSPRRAMRAGQVVNTRDLTSPVVIARNDMVEVQYQDSGIELTITGRAQRQAAVGDAVTILNTQSNRTIEAVAVSPGRAIAGPAAQAMRSTPARSLQFAAR
ncbi:flagellar basal body P-ring biosynthesis protein FlgA [Brevundimonas sp. GN22]|uniref:flagellar basal body P-ring formation chaperone FlgA n=1 Tax=Brevundimonas pishanensis TaxID=2896315 RepID=UPI001FA790A6|nr:flagellar basal body P-ring formation chaperone FlgA [Brevundimonas pishanensis]